MNKTIIATLVALTFTPSVYADETIELDDITVSSNRFEHKDTETTYASEIHTAKKIESSGAATLLDYLAQQTSLNATSINKATAAINLRGYGNENGNQNVVITVDGQRLNNIDLTSQLLAGIPLSNIERIEISKGSGSVIYGDGATAGAIQIYTKAKSGVTITTSLGNYGQKNHAIHAGISEEKIDLSVTLAHDSHDGFSKKDGTGHKDQFTSNSQNVKLKIKPTQGLSFTAEGTSSRNDTRYVNPMTNAEFKDDPRQVTNRPFSQTYTHQALDSDRWHLGAAYDISENVTVKASHFREDKTSDFINFANAASDYDYEGNDLSISYVDEVLNLIVGMQTFDGDRVGSTNVTTKDNEAYFASVEHYANWLVDGLTLSAGFRNEKVSYDFKPTLGQALDQTDHLNAWDVGANYRFSSKLSVFSNYNSAFQAPDIDRFFTFGGAFNSFIKPAKVKTLTVGLNHTLANNRLKISAFHANLDDEIYLDPTIGFFGTNSNLDKTHKYGIEVQDYYQFNSALKASMIYNYTRAKIDKEQSGAGAFNGKNLPGVPKHTLIANVNYTFYTNASLNINHTWRSKAYAYNDFENNFTQKQDSYNSTNIAVNYKYQNLNFFASVNNLFEQENSIQVQDDAIYPVDFLRTWRIGMKADF